MRRFLQLAAVLLVAGCRRSAGRRSIQDREQSLPDLRPAAVRRPLLPGEQRLLGLLHALTPADRGDCITTLSGAMMRAGGNCGAHEGRVGRAVAPGAARIGTERPGRQAPGI
jgi:hypothetical protein